jgi:iron complex transport system substrate-binding protein
MRKFVLPALVAAASLAMYACGGDDGGGGAAEAPSQTTTAAMFPVTVEGASGKALTITSRPERIVSLSPTATEMLFAIGAGGQVKAVDDQSNFPQQAPRTKLSGFQPNVEAIAGYRPDLVLLSNDEQDVVAGLDRLSIPTLLLPAAQKLDGTYGQIELVGKATGHRSEATATVTKMKADIDAIVAGIPERAAPLTYYHELDDTLFSVTSQTFIGQIYSLVGLKNIADKADKEGSGYPQLSPEYLVKADPDLIFLADTKCCGQSAQTLAKRSGFANLAAVKNGTVIPLDDDIASRWGPRVVDFLRTVAAAVAKAPRTSG